MRLERKIFWVLLFTGVLFCLIYHTTAIYSYGPEQQTAAETSRSMYQQSLCAAGHGLITTEIRPAPAFYYAEEYHQQYLAKNPGGYCGLAGTGVACPVGCVASKTA